MSGTMRSRMEAIIAACDAVTKIGDDGKWHNVPDQRYRDLARVARVAADDTLTDLNNARTVYRCQPGCADCDLRDEPWRSNDIRCAVIPDPDSRGAA